MRLLNTIFRYFPNFLHPKYYMMYDATIIHVKIIDSYREWNLFFVLGTPSGYCIFDAKGDVGKAHAVRALECFAHALLRFQSHVNGRCRQNALFVYKLKTLLNRQKEEAIRPAR
jgi:hypothetical protein